MEAEEIKTKRLKSRCQTHNVKVRNKRLASLQLANPTEIFCNEFM